ncbi:MAG: DUF86 domain-containing protein [Opitutales bacterium]|nr:DUF86 domain-containing protein [Opitutales bacterium]
MLESAKQAVSYVQGQTFEQFWDDFKTRDAVAMRLTIIGEAARQVSPETAATMPQIPIHAMRGLRNRIAHTYDQVDFTEVWKITQHDLKPLITELAKSLRAQEKAQILAQQMREAHHLSSNPPRPKQGPRMGI